VIKNPLKKKAMAIENITNISFSELKFFIFKQLNLILKYYKSQ